MHRMDLYLEETGGDHIYGSVEEKGPLLRGRGRWFMGAYPTQGSVTVQ